LESFIDVVMHAARAAQLPLTTGVSFGFRIPRISAAWSDYNPGAAFLRLSAGVCPDRAAQLGVLIARCASEFTAAAPPCP